MLTLQGNEVLVDLPCSGTSSLMIIIGTLTVFCAIHRPRPVPAALWFGLSLAMSVIFNSFCITLLSLGGTHREVLPFDVMAEPTHGIIGFFTLGLSLIPLFWWSAPKHGIANPCGILLFRLSLPDMELSQGVCFGGGFCHC